MNSIVPHIPEQLSKIAAGQTACRQHQKALIETVRSLNSTVVQHQELRASLQQEYDTSLRVHDERTAAEFRRRTEQSDSVAAAKLAEIDADRLRTVGEANGVCHDEQKQVQQAFEHENWVLQSVCDDEGEDTPITRSRSFAETFENQSQVMDELLVTLRERIKNTDQYLTRCHAGMESELPASSLTNGTREENREAAQKHSNEAFLAADQIDGLMIPGWVSGFRLLIIFFFITIVLLVPVASLRSDVRAFFSPELGNPDWGWLGVSALISGGVALLTSTVLMVIAQQQLRSRFQMMLQHASDAEAACGWWKTQSARESERMNHSAAAWQTQLIEQRDRRGAALAASFQNKQNVILQTLRDTTADIEQKASLQSEDVRRAQAAERSAAEAWRAEETAKFREQRRIEFEAAVSHADAECAQTIAALAETQKQVIDRWNGVLRETAAFSQLCTDTVSGVVQWPNLKDNRIPIPETLPSVLAAGNLHFTLAGLPPQNAPEENTVVSLEMPAILRFPTDTGIVVRHDTVGRESALEFVRAIILKLLTTIPPGRIQLTLIDPVGLGESFSALMHIADFDELLIGSRIWTESGQIRERLRKITDHMENVFQTYLRSEFSTIEQYNAAAGEVAEPYHFVIIAGFPTSFTEESARHLTSILASGPRCGVRPIITWDTDTVVPGWFDVTNLTKECIEFQVINRKVHLKGQDAVVSDAATIRYDSLQPPASSEYVRYVRAIGEASRGARRVEVSFARIAPREENIWTYSTAEGIDLPIGRAGAARLQTMKLGRGTSQHVLIAGKTGSGKSTLLHILITNMALHYSPNEIQFYLIDFKKGVEFRTYAANQLPHARVVAIESDREFGLSVLERLDEILQERGELFRSYGVQDLPAFRKSRPTETMPRLLLLIDEFQEFFVAEDRVSSRASLLLDRLIRQGRAFGIHVVLGSQTLGGAYSLARSTLGQVAVRIALQCSDSDAHLILSEENSAARLLTRPGEAIYNDANGLTEGNHPFQIAWMDEERREEAIADLVRRQRDSESGSLAGARGKSREGFRPGERGMIVFEGNVAPTVERCAPLNAWLRDSSSSTRRAAESLPIWLGEPVAISAPTCVELRRAGGQNLLIVGQDADMADGLLVMAALSCCHQPAAGSAAPMAAVPSDASSEFVDSASSSSTVGAISAGVPHVCLLHEGRDRESLNRFTATLQETARNRMSVHSVADADAVMASLHQQLIHRENIAAQGDLPELLLLIRNIGLFRTLRREEDEFGLGSFGAPKTITPAAQLADLIKRGPVVGIHVLIWSDTYNNAVRWLSTSLLREFENRVAFRMNQADSASLVDSPVAGSLGPGRAILYRDQTGAAEKFRPFAWPTSDWLREIFPDSDSNQIAQHPVLTTLMDSMSIKVPAGELVQAIEVADAVPIANASAAVKTAEVASPAEVAQVNDVVPSSEPTPKPDDSAIRQPSEQQQDDLSLYGPDINSLMIE